MLVKAPTQPPEAGRGQGEATVLLKASVGMLPSCRRSVGLLQLSHSSEERRQRQNPEGSDFQGFFIFAKMTTLPRGCFFPSSLLQAEILVQ